MDSSSKMEPVFRSVDVLVCGGGPSGVAAAVAAARGGARTLIIERYGRLGGAGVTSMVNPLMGRSATPLMHEIISRFERVHEGDWETLDLVYADLVEEAGAEILLHAWVFDVLTEGDTVVGVRVLTKQGILPIRAGVTVDATADGDIAYAAGAAFEQGRAGDGLLQPMTIMFRLGGVDKDRGLLCGSEEAAHQRTVPGGTWHEVTAAAVAAGELPANVSVVRLYESPRPGERIVNATQVNNVDGTKVADLTRAELEGRRQARAITTFIRRHAPGYESSYISHMPQAIGVRETRRFLGMEYLTREDLIAGRRWDSAVVRDASFVIDIHNPAGGGQAHGFAEKVQDYDIPYGCLVPRTTDGLLLAGRCISGSHEAHASYRVQRIAMSIGAAAGAAAALATQRHVRPREVDPASVQAALGLSKLSPT